MPDLHHFDLTSANSPLTQLDDAHSLGARLFTETIAAHGGEDFLHLKTLKITGKGEFTTPPQTGGLKVPLASFTLYVATEGRFRLEARSPGGPILFVTRGHDKGGFMVLAGRNFPLPAEQTNEIEPTEFLRTTARQGYPVVALPDTVLETTPDGKTLLCYEVLRSQGSVTRVFVEADTKLVRKTVTETTRGEMTVLLSRYEMVSGLPLFGEIQVLENGANVIKLVSSEILLDETLKDTLFERP